MPKKQSARAKADEAYRRMFDVPLLDGALPGQLDAISGEVAGAPREPDIPEWGSVPPNCPGCGRVQSAQRGWTAMLHVPGHAHSIQCGGCGHIARVAESVWERVRQIARTEFAASDAKPVKVETRRVRGAG